jgi:biopolymer transport protein ExbD
MAIPRTKARASAEVPTASMADIAFLLLVFFLVTTVFDEEKGLRVTLPELQSEVEVTADNILFFRVHTDGRIRVQRGEDAAEQEVVRGDIAAVWRREVAANPDLIAAVMTAPDAPYHLMVDVLDELQAAKAARVSLQLLPDEQ